MSLLFYWNEKLENRERFEKKNKFEYMAQTFKDKGVVADICFEFSSEGEYQQVAPLITDALGLGQKVELVFFSPSVEKAIMALAAQYPTQIRYLRYPFVRFFPFISRRSFTHWVTARTLVMVRYDLFPEFLLWGMHPDHKLKILWFTFKKDRLKGKGVTFWKSLFLKNSSTVIYASELDERMGQEAGFPGLTFDFRVEQIRRRIKDREEKFKSHFPIYGSLKINFDRYPIEKRLIIGNAWPNDLFLLNDFPQDVLIVIVPHDLSSKVINEFKVALKNLNLPFQEVTEQTETLESARCILLNKKGILCELYTDFKWAYVGGGFNGSIHSVLEPFVAGSESISCGPEHLRSTEYDLVLAHGRMTEIKTPEQFKLWMNSPKALPEGDKINAIFDSYGKIRQQVIRC